MKKPPVFELPTPVLAQTHGQLTSVEDATDVTRNDPFIRLAIRLGTMDGQRFVVAPTQPIRRWVRGPELRAFITSQPQGAPEGEWRTKDLIRWVREHGLESPHRIDADTFRTPGPEAHEPELESTEPEKKGLWQKLNTPIGDLIRGR